MEQAIKAKYQALSQKLISNKYHQPLHPDSVPLVQRLLRDIQKVSTQYQKLLKETSHTPSQISNNSSDLSKTEDPFNSQYKFNLLNEQYTEVTKKLKLKQDELQLLLNGNDQHSRIHQLRVKYDTKVNEFLNTIQNLEKKEMEVTNKNRRLEESVDCLSRELDNVKDELQNKEKVLLNETKERISIRKQYDDVLNNTCSLENRTVEEMNSIIGRKTERIQELEGEIKGYEARLGSNKAEIQEMMVEKKHLTLENKNLNCIIDSLKDQIREFKHSDANMKIKHDQMAKELDGARKHRLSLEKQMQEMRTSEIEKSYSNEAKDSAKEKISSMYTETCKLLEAKTLQYQRLESEKEGLEKIVNTLDTKMKEVSNKNLVLNRNIGNLQEEYDLINGKYSAKLKEYHELNTQKEYFERAGKELEPLKEKWIELEAKYNQLLASGDASNDLDSRGKRELEHQIRVLKQENELLRERDSQRQIQSEKQSGQLQKVRIYMENGNKQIEIINSQKQSLLKQNSELKQQLDALSLKVTNTCTEDLKKTQKINSDQILIHDMRNKIEHQSDKVRALLDENKLLETNLRKTQEKNKQLYQDNVQLKAMYESVEYNKNQLLGKLKRSTSQKEFIETEKVKESGEIQKLKMEIQHLREQIQEKDRAIVEINNLRDDQEAEYNNKLQENYELEERIRALEQQLREYDQKQGESQYSALGFQEENKSLRNERNTLIKKNEKLEAELKNSKAQMSRDQAQIQKYKYQMTLLVNNNRILSEQIAQHQNALASLQQIAEQRTRDLDESRTNAQMNKVESDQLQQQYLDNVNERKRLESFIREMEQENHKMYDHLHIRDQQIEEYNQILNSEQYKIKQYEDEIRSYQKQLNLLTTQVNMKDEDYRKASMERDFLKSEVSVRGRQSNIDWKSLMEERLHSAQCELNLKKREIEGYVVENRKLNSVLENERMVNYKLTKEIEEMRFGSHTNTPIRNLICQSLDNSEIENSSLHSNLGGDHFNERDARGGLTSFESEGSLSSKDLMNNFVKIKEKYNMKVTGASGRDPLKY